MRILLPDLRREYWTSIFNSVSGPYSYFYVINFPFLFPFPFYCRQLLFLFHLFSFPLHFCPSFFNIYSLFKHVELSTIMSFTSHSSYSFSHLYYSYSCPLLRLMFLLLFMFHLITCCFLNFLISFLSCFFLSSTIYLYLLFFLLLLLLLLHASLFSFPFGSSILYVHLVQKY